MWPYDCNFTWPLALWSVHLCSFAVSTLWLRCLVRHVLCTLSKGTWIPIRVQLNAFSESIGLHQSLLYDVDWQNMKLDQSKLCKCTGLVDSLKLWSVNYFGLAATYFSEIWDIFDANISRPYTTHRRSDGLHLGACHKQRSSAQVLLTSFLLLRIIVKCWEMNVNNMFQYCFRIAGQNW